MGEAQARAEKRDWRFTWAPPLLRLISLSVCCCGLTLSACAQRAPRDELSHAHAAQSRGGKQGEAPLSSPPRLSCPPLLEEREIERLSALAHLTSPPQRARPPRAEAPWSLEHSVALISEVGLQGWRWYLASSEGVSALPAALSPKMSCFHSASWRAQGDQLWLLVRYSLSPHEATSPAAFLAHPQLSARFAALMGTPKLIKSLLQALHTQASEPAEAQPLWRERSLSAELSLMSSRALKPR